LQLLFPAFEYGIALGVKAFGAGTPWDVNMKLGEFTPPLIQEENDEKQWCHVGTTKCEGRSQIFLCFQVSTPAEGLASSALASFQVHSNFVKTKKYLCT